MLWYEMMGVNQIVGFILPDWIADLVPGKYPVHSADGTVKPNFKSKVLDVSLAVTRLDRIIEIQKILIDQVRVLETMTAMDFLEFRDHLFPSSGFQSSQFRQLENKLGLKKTDRINYGGKDYKLAIKKNEKDNVGKSESQPSLFQLLETWLERTPFLQFKGFDFWDQYSFAVQSLLEGEENVIKNNPNYSKEEVVI